MRMRVAYGRVSTASGEQLSALETQLAWLRNQACDLVLSDVESGRNVERPDYQRLRSLIEAGQVAEVVALRLDRLGRLASECDAFVELCDRQQTAVTTRDDGRLTMATPEDLLLTRLKASLAQGESMKISQRVRKAREQGKRDGKPMKRPCFGYQLSSDRKSLEVHPEQGPIARELIAALKASGWRMQPVLEVFQGRIPLNSVRALRSWLLNPTIRGALAYGQLKNHQFSEVLWGQHEALLSHDDFAAMQVVIERNRLLWGRHGVRQLRALTGLCVCSECGNRLAYIPGRTHPSLRCRGDVCSQRYKGVREDAILFYATEALAAQAAEQLAAMAEATEPAEAATLRAQIAALEKQSDPDLEEVITKKRSRLKALLHQPQGSQELARKISDPRWFDTLTYEELGSVLHQVVERIVITKQAPSALIQRR
jgi:DNA invertase Pin-like site-specific DNA recombinase